MNTSVQLSPTAEIKHAITDKYNWYKMDGCNYLPESRLVVSRRRPRDSPSVILVLRLTQLKFAFKQN